MSRIYDNQPLTNLPLINIDVSGSWNKNDFTRGPGVIFEGVVQKRAHFVICDGRKTKTHYYIMYIKLSRAHRRKFDENGVEVEPNFSETRKVNTGYLNSSYKVESKGETDKLSEETAQKLLTPADLAPHMDRYGAPGLVGVWLDEAQAQGLEFEMGNSVRVKTQGDGPFVITKLDSGSSNRGNFAGGESTGASWTDKIMDVKAVQNAMAGSDQQGVDDDEW
ncbi:ARPIN-like protein, partial [Mya arenaria]